MIDAPHWWVEHTIMTPDCGFVLLPLLLVLDPTRLHPPQIPKLGDHRHNYHYLQASDSSVSRYRLNQRT